MDTTKTKAQWVKELYESHKAIGAGKADLEAKVKYLAAVKQFPLYGGTPFEVEYKGFWSFPNKFVTLCLLYNLTMPLQAPTVDSL